MANTNSPPTIPPPDPPTSNLSEALSGSPRSTIASSNPSPSHADGHLGNDFAAALSQTNGSQLGNFDDSTDQTHASGKSKSKGRSIRPTPSENVRPSPAASPAHNGYEAPPQEEEWVTAPKKLTKKQAATHAATDEALSRLEDVILSDACRVLASAINEAEFKAKAAARATAAAKRKEEAKERAAAARAKAALKAAEAAAAAASTATDATDDDEQSAAGGSTNPKDGNKRRDGKKDKNERGEKDERKREKKEREKKDVGKDKDKDKDGAGTKVVMRERIVDGKRCIAGVNGRILPHLWCNACGYNGQGPQR